MTPMTRVDRWWSESPRRPPAEYACELARSCAWPVPEVVFVTTVPDPEEAAPLLELEIELAHAPVLVLSQLPGSLRRAFADSSYAERDRRSRESRRFDPEAKLAIAAAVALLVANVTGRADLRDVRMLDLLQGAAQGDDLSQTPEPTRERIAEVVARARLDVAREDALTPTVAATTAIVEVLDPSSETVALQEVVLRATWAVLQTSALQGVTEFLLSLDEIFAGASSRGAASPSAR